MLETWHDRWCACDLSLKHFVSSETGVEEKASGPEWPLQAYCKRRWSLCQKSGGVKETEGQTWADVMCLFPDTRHPKLQNKR